MGSWWTEVSLPDGIGLVSDKLYRLVALARQRVGKTVGHAAVFLLKGEETKAVNFIGVGRCLGTGSCLKGRREG